MAEIRTRKDVWKMDEWDPTLLWYSKAIAEMQRRPIKDPTSWRYQAAIHDYVRANDPHASHSDRLPSKSDQRHFWRQCQHFSWFFLPWHRMYLGYFEQIVAAAVRDLGGPADWALPYWNYSDTRNPKARLLPPAFRARTLPDGSENALRVEQRAPGVNEGEEFADDRDVDIVVALREEDYIAARLGGDPGFGGPRTKFNHSSGRPGQLEAVPHGSMHVAIGGDNGWMSAFETAGLDPIFWLHHCNLDRLWAVWLQRDSQHTDPGEAEWLTSISFEFHDAGGHAVSLTTSQVSDSTTPPLSYKYEDVSDPLGAAPRPLTEAPRRLVMEEPPIPEMVGATDQPLTLTGETATASVPVTRPTGPAHAAMAAGGSPKRVHLNLENITSTGRPGSYSVYVNLPAGADPAKHPELYAGMLPMFGVSESSDPARGHSGSGLHYSLDITSVVQALEAKGAWKPDELRVTFVPKRRHAARAAVAASPVQVGRVSLYFS